MVQVNPLVPSLTLGRVWAILVGIIFYVSGPGTRKLLTYYFIKSHIFMMQFSIIQQYLYYTFHLSIYYTCYEPSINAVNTSEPQFKI